MNMSTLIDASEDEQRATLLGHEPTEDEIDERSLDDPSIVPAENNREPSVSLAFLLILTCGVAG